MYYIRHMATQERLQGAIGKARNTLTANKIAEVHYKNATEAQAFALSRHLAEIGATLPEDLSDHIESERYPIYFGRYEASIVFYPETAHLEEREYYGSTSDLLRAPQEISKDRDPHGYLRAGSIIIATIEEKLKDRNAPISQ